MVSPKQTVFRNFANFLPKVGELYIVCSAESEFIVDILKQVRAITNEFLNV